MPNDFKNTLCEIKSFTLPTLPTQTSMRKELGIGAAAHRAPRADPGLVLSLLLLGLSSYASHPSPFQTPNPFHPSYESLNSRGFEGWSASHRFRHTHSLNPSILHPTPYTLRHTPFTPHPAPHTLRRAPRADSGRAPHPLHSSNPTPSPNPTPYTIHHTPCTIHHTPDTIHHTRPTP